MTSHKELNIFLLPCYRGKKCSFYLCWFMYSTKIFFPEPLKDFCTSTGLLTCLQDTVFVGKRIGEDNEESRASRS